MVSERGLSGEFRVARKAFNRKGREERRQRAQKKLARKFQVSKFQVSSGWRDLMCHEKKFTGFGKGFNRNGRKERRQRAQRKAGKEVSSFRVSSFEWMARPSGVTRRNLLALEKTLTAKGAKNIPSLRKKRVRGRAPRLASKERTRTWGTKVRSCAPRGKRGRLPPRGSWNPTLTQRTR
jgi:hypothetical protein